MVDLLSYHNKYISYSVQMQMLKYENDLIKTLW